MAQSTNSPARTIVLEDLQLTKVYDMDFGGIVVDGTAGTVVMTPDLVSPVCTATGVVHFAECQPAVFGGKGSSNQQVRLRLPPGAQITLTGPGADMIIDQLSVQTDDGLNRLSSAGNRRNIRYRIASSEGAFFFAIGGRLNLAGNQAPGLYTGTFDVELDYR